MDTAVARLLMNLILVLLHGADNFIGAAGLYGKGARGKPIMRRLNISDL